jgi:mono/diheme cytochrome c family protein
MIIFRLLSVALLALSVAGAGPVPQAQPAGDGTFSSDSGFKAQDGEVLYRDVCQGCHMAQGQGAVGAGTYPALAGDSKLASADYVVAIILHGSAGMPGFSYAMTDAQIAAVANFIRTHFGNEDAGVVTAAEVEGAR